jgi:hypothetical protein
MPSIACRFRAHLRWAGAGCDLLLVACAQLKPRHDLKLVRKVPSLLCHSRIHSFGFGYAAYTVEFAGPLQM